MVGGRPSTGLKFKKQSHIACHRSTMIPNSLSLMLAAWFRFQVLLRLRRHHFVAVLVFAVAFLTNVAHAFAQQARLRLRVNTRPGQVEMIVQSTGRRTATDVQIRAEIGDEKYAVGSIAALPPGQRQVFRFQPKVLPQQGTYAVLSRVTFRSDATMLSLVNAAYLHAPDKPRISKSKLDLHIWPLRPQGYAVIRFDKRHRMRLLLPNGVRVLSQQDFAEGRRYRLAHDHPQRGGEQSVFAVLEVAGDDGPERRILSRRIRMKPVVKERSVFSRGLLLAFGLASLLMAFFLYTSRSEVKRVRDHIALVRFTFTIAIVSFWLLLMRSLFVVPDWFVAHITRQEFFGGRLGAYLYRVCRLMADWLYFAGKDYDFFFRYVQDTLYAWVLTGNFFWIRYVLRTETNKDKYWHLLRSFFSLRRFFVGRSGFFWSDKAKVALLALLVKGFYVPLVCSWTINNIYHQIFLSKGFVWTFFAVQAYLVASLIFIDVAIFCFGYLVEAPRLNNQIRSVEPTLLGWAVCLMCYPPFNRFSFDIFNRSLFGPHTASEGLAQRLCLALVAVLWMVYTWASIALGAKASNLTNRGIVSTGPYALVRHPAYISKISLWAISAYFLANKLFLMVCGLALVYLLRAITEERHLSKDPDYLAYKEQVPYRFIPGLF